LQAKSTYGDRHCAFRAAVLSHVRRQALAVAGKELPLALLRFIFRSVAVVSLAVAVIMAVLDATRSLAADALVTTPLGESWFAVSPSTLDLAQALVQRYLSPELWDPYAIWVLGQPGFAVMAVLSLLFYILGRRSRRRNVYEPDEA
jgi:hypothetical protein